MPTRAEILEQFRLPGRVAFEIEPHRHEGMWRVKISHQGDPTKLMRPDYARRFAKAIRTVDPELAERIDACVETAERYAMDSN